MLDNFAIVFTCCECDQLFNSFETFECHIWNRHIGTFPYSCALCGFPALNANAFCAHFTEKHGEHHKPEFKRKVDDEKKLWSLIVGSLNVELCTEMFDEPHYTENNSVTEISPPSAPNSSNTTSAQNDSEFWHVEPSTSENVILQSSSSSISNQWFPPMSPPVSTLPSTSFHSANPPLKEKSSTSFASSSETALIIVEKTECSSPQAENQSLVQDSELDAFYEESSGYIEENEDFSFFECEEENAFEISQTRPSNGKLNKMIPKFGYRKLLRKPEKIHQCDICGKVNKFLSKAIEHRRTHSGEKPFKCTHCTRSFTQKGALNAHIRLHTGEKPFKCQWECGKYFNSSSACKIHEKSHAGEKCFRCIVCGKLFGKRYNYDRHMKAVHPTSQISSAIKKVGSLGNRYGLQAAGSDEPLVRNAVLAVVNEVQAQRESKQVGRLLRENAVFDGDEFDS